MGFLPVAVVGKTVQKQATETATYERREKYAKQYRNTEYTK
jgi:hypothetical protein